MQKVLIVGAGGFAKEAAWLIEEINENEEEWDLLGFIDKDEARLNETIGRWRVLYTDTDLPNTNLALALAIGNPRILEDAAKKFQIFSRIIFPNFIHPTVCYDLKGVGFGKGNLVCAGNVITTDILIGSFNILNLSSTFGHDCVIEDYCVINPGCNISGGVKIRSGALIGSGATVLQNLTIGYGATVGAGSVVTQNVPDGQTVVGVPAKPLKKKWLE